MRTENDGMHFAVEIGSADTGDVTADARSQRFRSELASVPSNATVSVSQLLDQDWRLLVSSPTGGESTVGSLAEWFKVLNDDPAASGRISMTLGPDAVEQAGPAVADELVQLLRAALPLEVAAEAAMKDPVQALVSGLLWDEDRARSLIALTRRAKQLPFAGPPGTGKTLAAPILAGALADESRIKLVQFHPTYAYEDFVEGIRPVISESASTDGADGTTSSSSSGLRYEIRDGVFKEIVRDARSTPPEAAHFLIVDEINRANLPRVLGELLFALEYRGEQNKVELAYSTDEFYVPENLWVIGTMNTADRSVALLDAAMRRRFKEVRFDIAGCLRDDIGAPPSRGGGCPRRRIRIRIIRIYRACGRPRTSGSRSLRVPGSTDRGLLIERGRVLVALPS